MCAEHMPCAHHLIGRVQVCSASMLGIASSEAESIRMMRKMPFFSLIGNAILFFRDGDALHGVSGESWVLVRIAAGNTVNYVHAADDLSEDCIAAIQ